MSLFEQILSFRGYPLKAAKAELAYLQAMSVDEFATVQEQKAWGIAKHHYDNNDVYKKLVGNTFPTRWEDLPIVTKKHLQQRLEQLLTRGVNLSACHVGSTSGSTGTPFHFAKDKFCHAMTWAVIADRYSWYDIGFSSRQARFYGIPLEWKSKTVEQLKDRTMNRERFSVFDLSDNVLRKFEQRITQGSFEYLYGYTSALVMFARYLLLVGKCLKDRAPGLKVCIVTSETCTAEDSLLLERAFGIPVVREYGLSETCITAFDYPQGYWQVNNETLYTETVNDSNDVVSDVEGRILSTSLYNRAFPMVRYETGDVGVIEGAPNNRYTQLKQLSGRVNDTIVLPGGKKAAGLTFYYISRSVLEQSGVLKEFIIRQTKEHRFEFDIVSDRELTEEEIKLLQEKVTLYLQPCLEVIINRVAHITRPTSGKLKHFYSELN